MSESGTVFYKLSSETSWIESKQFPIPNRAMNFGDGVFETMLFEKDTLRYFELHIDRAYLGLKALRIESNGREAEELLSLLRTNFSGQKVRVRWNLFRAGSGKYFPETNSLSQVVIVEPFQATPAKKKTAGLATGIHLSANSISRFKTLNSLPYVLAAIERMEKGWEEIILTDTEGNISEAGFSAIFWRQGEEVFTPSLETGCIQGIGREVILNGLKERNLSIHIGKFKKDQLFQADQVWVCNALGVSYLERIENTEFSTKPWEILSEIHK